MISFKGRIVVSKLTDPIGRFLLRMGLTPDAMTILGTVVTVADAAVSVAATAVKATATVVGTTVDVAASEGSIRYDALPGGGEIAIRPLPDAARPTVDPSA